MNIIGTQRFSSLGYVACLTITTIAFGSLIGTPQLLFAQGEATETFFEESLREAGQTGQQNETAAAAAPPSPPAEQQNETAAAAAPPSPPAEQQNETQSQNPFEQLGQAISRLFGGN